MVKKLHLIFLWTVFSGLLKANAQVPQMLNYQAVVRDAAGQIISGQKVSLRFTIHDGKSDGPVVYEEIQPTETNQFGLVNLKIGEIKSLQQVNWGSGAKYLQVELDQNNSGQFVDMGASELLSVPYALYAEKAGSAVNGNKPGTEKSDATGLSWDCSTYTLTDNSDGSSVQLANCDGSFGITGPTGPTGATGLISSGTTAGNTPYWDGTQWVVNSSNIYNNGGNVGIGTSSPTSILHVADSSAGTSITVQNLGGNGLSALVLGSQVNNIASIIYNTNFSGYFEPHMLVIQNYGLGPRPDLTIDYETGYVGIGNPSPGAQLDVAGNTRTVNFQMTTGASGGYVLTSDDNGNATWQAISGASGATGPTGATGNDGATGPNGANGQDGAQGAQGATGATGATGQDGAQGPTGITGANGQDGAQGPTGPTGVNGQNGAQGPQGSAGPAGATGQDGAQGSQGVTGPTGTNGQDGTQGAQGPIGASGPSGTTGPTGATGPLGFLPNGNAAGNTPYYNGTNWVTNSSAIYNDGSNIGVGNSSPQASAILDLTNTTNKGFLLPSVSANAHPTSPAQGLMVFDTTSGCIEFFVAGSWQTVACKCSSPPAQPLAINAAYTNYCPNQPYVFNVGSVSGANNYVWGVSPLTATDTIAGQGTSQTAITFNNTLATSVTVNAINSCGMSSTQSIAVTAITSLGRPSGINQSPTHICNGDTVTLTSFNVPNAQNYVWTVPPTCTIIQSGTSRYTATNATAPIQVIWHSSVNNTATITAHACTSIAGTADSLQISFYPVPATPDTAVASKLLFCPHDTVVLTTHAVTYATSYRWQLPAGWTAVGGNDTTTNPSITVVTGNAATGNVLVKVSAANCSGASTFSSANFPPVGHGSATFSYTGGSQAFVYPPCINSVKVTIAGGGGGSATYALAGIPSSLTDDATHGKGAVITATLNFTGSLPDTLFINVGQKGAPGANGGIQAKGGNGGYNAGGTWDGSGGNGILKTSAPNYIFSSGAGGAESDIRIGNKTLLADRIIAAGGGGGVGVTPSGAGIGGGNGFTSTSNYAGSNGAPATGCAGQGTGAATNADGAAGSYTCAGTCSIATAASAGVNSTGGNGGSNSTQISGVCIVGAGGGGGGGYFGGGGGVDAGGGGGSCKVVSPVNVGGTTCTISNISVNATGNAGNGLITITW